MKLILSIFSIVSNQGGLGGLGKVKSDQINL
jgi:hypothetical protein